MSSKTMMSAATGKGEPTLATASISGKRDRLITLSTIFMSFLP
jgi:hypothetical protein